MIQIFRKSDFFPPVVYCLITAQQGAEPVVISIGRKGGCSVLSPELIFIECKLFFHGEETVETVVAGFCCGPRRAARLHG